MSEPIEDALILFKESYDRARQEGDSKNAVRRGLAAVLAATWEAGYAASEDEKVIGNVNPHLDFTRDIPPDVAPLNYVIIRPDGVPCGYHKGQPDANRGVATLNDEYGLNDAPINEQYIWMEYRIWKKLGRLS